MSSHIQSNDINTGDLQLTCFQDLLKSFNKKCLAPYEADKVKLCIDSLSRTLGVFKTTINEMKDIKRQSAQNNENLDNQSPEQQQQDNQKVYSRQEMKEMAASHKVLSRVVKIGYRALTSYHVNRSIQISETVINKQPINEDLLSQPEKHYLEKFRRVQANYLKNNDLIGYKITKDRYLFASVQIVKDVELFLQPSDGQVMSMLEGEVYYGYIEDCEYIIQQGWGHYIN